MPFDWHLVQRFECCELTWLADHAFWLIIFGTLAQQWYGTPFLFNMH